MKKRIPFVLLFTFILFSAFADPFNNKLSADERNTISSGEILIKNINYEKFMCLKKGDSELGNKLLDCKETKFSARVLEDDLGLKKPEGIILESEDGNFRCRLTLTEVLARLLDANRAELSNSLFGGNL